MECFSTHWICNGLYRFHPSSLFLQGTPSEEGRFPSRKSRWDENFPNALSLQVSEALQEFILHFSFHAPHQRFRERFPSRQVGWNGKLNAVTSFLSLILSSIFTSAADVRTSPSSSATIMAATPVNRNCVMLTRIKTCIAPDFPEAYHAILSNFLMQKYSTIHFKYLILSFCTYDFGKEHIVYIRPSACFLRFIN